MQEGELFKHGRVCRKYERIIFSFEPIKHVFFCKLSTILYYMNKNTRVELQLISCFPSYTKAIMAALLLQGGFTSSLRKKKIITHLGFPTNFELDMSYVCQGLATITVQKKIDILDVIKKTIHEITKKERLGSVNTKRVAFL
jgi:hypothetical protein